MEISSDNPRIFAQAMSRLTGVEVEVHSGDPATNGKKVWLSSKPSRNWFEADAMLGIAAHEIMHVAFRSVVVALPTTVLPNGDTELAAQSWPKRMSRAVTGDEKRTWLAKECINVVLDIADETRGELLFPKLESLFRRANLLSFDAHYTHLEMRRNNPGLSPAWRDFLMTGILKARLYTKNGYQAEWLVHNYRYLNYMVKTCSYLDGGYRFSHKETMSKISTICMGSRTKKKPKRSGRSSREWSGLYTKALKLFEIVNPMAQDQDEGSGPTDAKGDPSGDVQSKARAKVAQDIAGNKDVGTGHSSSYVRPGQTAEKTQQDAGACAQKSSSYDSKGKVDPFLFGKFRQQVSQAANLMFETEKAMVFTRHSDTGSKLGSLDRLFTDGKVFSKRQEDYGDLLSMALLVDKSGSMCGGHVYGQYSNMDGAKAIMAAFKIEMEARGAEIGMWSFSNSSVRLTDTTLPTLSGGGCTIASGAIRDATVWLKPKSGRRIMVIITDGSMGDFDSTEDACRRAIASGIEVILVGLDIHPQSLERWPHGVRRAICKGKYMGLLGSQLVRAAGAR